MRQAVFHELFDQDVESFARTLDADRPGLGDEFVVTVEKQVALIMERPESYRTIHGRTRRALIRRFQALVLFRSTDRHVFIAGVVHGARDLEAWLAHRLGT